HNEVAEAARAEDTHALRLRPGLDGPAQGAAELIAAPRRGLIGWVVGVQEYRHDRHDFVAHQSLMHEAPRVAEGRVPRLHPDVGDVAAMLAREGLHDVHA